MHYDRKLDAKLAAAIMSINAFKGVEIGIGFEAAHRPEVKFMMKFCGMRSMDIHEEQIMQVD